MEALIAAAGSWSRVRRIVAGSEGTDAHFIVTTRQRTFLPARRRLLAAVEPAGADAEGLVLARQFDTLRLRLIKTAARIVEMKTRIKVHLPSSAPDQAVWHLTLGRLPRPIT